MIKRLCQLVACCSAIAIAAPSSARNHVRIQSATIPADGSGTIGVFLTNDAKVNAFDIPLVVRSLEGNAFWDSVYVTYWQRRGQSVSLDLESFDDRDVDYISPDQCYFVWFEINCCSGIPPGTDEPDRPTIKLAIQANGHEGRFEIDTLVFPMGSYPVEYRFVVPIREPPWWQAIVPDFTRSEICINPAGWGDMDDDGTRDVADVVRLIDYLFRRSPSPVAGRADYDCSGRSNLVDVVRLIDTVLRGGRMPCCPQGAPE